MKELLQVSERPNGYSVEAQKNGTSATFSWDQKLGVWTMTKHERKSDKLIDPMTKVIWHDEANNGQSQSEKEPVNIIPALIKAVKENPRGGGYWIGPDTKVDGLVPLLPNQYATIPDYYQDMIQAGTTLVINAGGITKMPTPAKPKS